MFAPKDQKAKFRIGSKVSYDYASGVFKVISKSWGANGLLNYTVATTEGETYFVREKDLNKV